jgi:hypothetical protein
MLLRAESSWRFWACSLLAICRPVRNTTQPTTSAMIAPMAAVYQAPICQLASADAVVTPTATASG